MKRALQHSNGGAVLAIVESKRLRASPHAVSTSSLKYIDLTVRWSGTTAASPLLRFPFRSFIL